MDAGILKTEALCWLRFVKKMELVATEAGAWSADVLGMNETSSIELEVKVTKSDLRREFDQKRTKHYLYNGSVDDKPPTRHVPNYFYFYVPFWLQEEALKLIQLHSPKAGLAVYGEGKGHYLDGRRTVIVKKPTKLHGKAPSASFWRTLLLRMGSELCARYVAERELAECVAAFNEGYERQGLGEGSRPSQSVPVSRRRRRCHSNDR
jgi:hypothetical protein